MNKPKYWATKVIFYFSFISLMTSCGGNDLEEAKSSLDGMWTIQEIITSTGTRSNLGIAIDDTSIENGTLGTLDFTGSQCTYTIEGNSYEKMGEGPWSIESMSVNCGFTNCTVYVLTIDQDDYDCTFGDQTSDAHQNATMITLTMETEAIGPYTSRVLSLTKE